MGVGEMKRIDITAYGAPEEVASCVEVPDVGEAGPGEVCLLYTSDAADE